MTGDDGAVVEFPNRWPKEDVSKVKSKSRVGWDKEMPRARTRQGPLAPRGRPSPAHNIESGPVAGPVDLDDLDDSSLLSLSSGEESEDDREQGLILKKDVYNIPGSPWAKPRARHSKRPTEPLAIAKYASSLGLLFTLGWVFYLFVIAVWHYSSLGRVLVECVLAVLTFFGLFWNTYFTVSSIMKCFIPAKAFKENTKYFSVVPESKHPDDPWLDCTIQIPVYKESLSDVLGPTLESCIQARTHYEQNTKAICNIVVCDDGMMNMLRDNFSAAEMLWQNVQETKGRVPIKLMLQRVPRAARRHLSGLRSKNIIEVFNRMLFYYHNDIGFVARSTLDRRGKFKKASNLNTHLRLVFGAQQICEETGKFDEACLETAHNDDGSREVMFGGNIVIGDLMIINDADARMSPPVIMKTVPEFLNDKRLGFTQHATKTMNDQRGESYYLRMIEVYTDALYQGHFLLSSILGCHPPLVGHSIFLRSDAVRQTGRMRMLRKAQHWLDNIGLPFLGVDQLGFTNLQGEKRTEYWSECHVSEDFELMIHLYNIGYSGRYVAFPNCEFQEGVTRTFDEEAGRHRKFALGGHELMFHPFQDWFGHGIFTPLFRTFLTCDIPSYYKIFLTSYLFSYTSGGVYVIVFLIAAVARIIQDVPVDFFYAFSPAAILIINILVYYVIGYSTFIIALCRMHYHNKKIFFPEYRNRGKLYLAYKQLRYALCFQMTFYTVMGNYFFLGGLDHLLSNTRICGATNKDALTVTRCEALKDVIRFNFGCWALSTLMGIIGVLTYWKDLDYTMDPNQWISKVPSLDAILFSGPPILMAIFAILIPIVLNPYICRLPFQRRGPKAKKPQRGSKPVKRQPSRLNDAGTISTRDYTYNHKTATNKATTENTVKVSSHPGTNGKENKIHNRPHHNHHHSHIGHTENNVGHSKPKKALKNATPNLVAVKTISTKPAPKKKSLDANNGGMGCI